ncbi:unnamed protein product [Pedinophyceae sp. YPF-701]|nr:unnamed protein product [Pedinophyceae sp. YPF-701]
MAHLAACAPLGACTTKQNASLRSQSARVVPRAHHADGETQAASPALTRRGALAAGIAAASLVLDAQESGAVGFKKELKDKRRGRTRIPEEEYTKELQDGVKYVDLEEGTGEVVKKGTKVTAHYDAFFRGIDASSSRQARFLNENINLPEPYDFAAGSEIRISKSKELPLPPQALTIGVIGMKPGGKRMLLVPADPWGYGDKGYAEVPPGATIEVLIELLSIGEA